MSYPSPWGPLLGPNVVVQDEVITIDHLVHVGFIILGIVGIRMIGHRKPSIKCKWTSK
jgi:hypothetical protein